MKIGAKRRSPQANHAGQVASSCWGPPVPLAAPRRASPREIRRCAPTGVRNARRFSIRALARPHNWKLTVSRIAGVKSAPSAAPFAGGESRRAARIAGRLAKRGAEPHLSELHRAGEGVVGAARVDVGDAEHLARLRDERDANAALGAGEQAAEHEVDADADDDHDEARQQERR